VKQEYTLTPGGEDKWLRPVSAVNASSVPVDEKRWRVYCSVRAFFQPYLYVGG